MPPLALSDIVFSEQANHNFSRILGDIKKSNLSISNRLTSILADAGFVAHVADVLALPLVANERCGSWYLDPRRKAASAYFKSTDGHAGQWQFSTRRLNLHLLEVIGEHDGCIVVDSTRRGKRIPDALSKTVPIWCCVLNRVLFPDQPAWHTLFVPPTAVSDSEKSQIEARIPGFVASLAQLDIAIAPLRQRLSKPLRPVWATPDGTSLEPLAGALPEWHRVVCCTSSRRVTGTEMSEGGYIQGAGDDTEAWAHGLTAPLFWRHRDELLTTDEADLPDLITNLLTRDEPDDPGAPSFRTVTPAIEVGALPVDDSRLDATTVLISLLPNVTPAESWVKSKTRMEVGVGKSKAASRMLRDALPHICQFVAQHLQGPEVDHPPRIAIACPTGKDLSVGLALALDCWFFDDSGHIRPDSERRFDKTGIRVRLGRIMQAVPETNPSRSTLQSVNSFLMDWRK